MILSVRSDRPALPAVEARELADALRRTLQQLEAYMRMLKVLRDDQIAATIETVSVYRSVLISTLETVA